MRRDVTDRKTRYEAILKYVKDNPGTSMQQASKALGESSKFIYDYQYYVKRKKNEYKPKRKYTKRNQMQTLIVPETVQENNNYVAVFVGNPNDVSKAIREFMR